MGMDLIRAGDLEQYSDRPDCLIIDLRSAEEYRRGHVRSAVSIPYPDLENASLPRTKTLIFYCQRGSLSLTACRKMKAKGYTALSVNGGYQAYVSHTGHGGVR